MSRRKKEKMQVKAQGYHFIFRSHLPHFKPDNGISGFLVMNECKQRTSWSDFDILVFLLIKNKKNALQCRSLHLTGVNLICQT